MTDAIPRLTATRSTTVLSVLALLIALPAAAVAQDKGCEHDPPACAAGSVWDPQTKSCIQVSS